MAMPLDLTGTVAMAINEAALRGHTVTIGYVDADGYPALSFRASIHVHGPQQIAFWARKPTGGIVESITDRPHVSLLYFEPDGPGPRFLSIRGTARVDRSRNEAVYAGMIQGERDQDPERNGVAVIIDVEFVRGVADGGVFEMQR